MTLIKQLRSRGFLKTERIIKAFERIDRKDFLPEDKRYLGEINSPIPIGHQQTISQPLVVAFMLEQLSPARGDRVLDIGSGSGWTTALLAEIVGKEGRVVGVEIIPELVEFGKKNIMKYNFIKKERATIIKGDGKKGFPEEAPYDRILVSAEADKLYPAWKKQLKKGGVIVTPIKKSIWTFKKKSGNKFTKKEHKGFAFVPCV